MTGNLKKAQWAKTAASMLALTAITVRIIIAFLAAPSVDRPFTIASADGTIKFVICSIFQNKLGQSSSAADEPATPLNQDPLKHCPLCPTLAGANWAVAPTIQSVPLPRVLSRASPSAFVSKRLTATPHMRPHARGPPRAKA